MAETTIIAGNLDVGGDLRFRGLRLPSIPRTELIQDNLAVFPINLASLRKIGTPAENPPGTGSSSYAAIASGTFGTSAPYLTSGDVKNSVTSRAVETVVQLPPSYVAGQTVKIRLAVGMLDRVATVYARITVRAYKVERNTTPVGSDLSPGTTQSINSTTFSDVDDTLTTTTLSPGDYIHLEITIECSDGSAASACTPCIAAIDLVCDVQG